MTHTHTHTREGHVKETKTSDAAASPGMPKAAGSYQKLQETRKDPTLQVLEGTWPC